MCERRGVLRLISRVTETSTSTFIKIILARVHTTCNVGALLADADVHTTCNVMALSVNVKRYLAVLVIKSLPVNAVTPLKQSVLSAITWSFASSCVVN